MLIVFPFCQADFKLAHSLAKYMQYLGPYKQHELMLVAQPELSQDAEELEKIIGDQFARILRFTPKVGVQKWPVGSNRMFHSVAYHIQQNVDAPFWFLLEPDNIPLKPGWANTLAEEYKRTNRPFMGVVHATWWRRADGTFYQDGIHLNGSAIYPKDTPRYSRLFHTIPDTSYPWDVYWQWEMIKYAAGTNLMQLEWRSFNFRRDKKTGEIIGDRAPNVFPDHIGIPRVRPDAVILHGCKDGSLMQIMRGFFTSRKEEPEELIST
jgi:hypothetical protein